jgi:hypothetical protein
MNENNIKEGAGRIQTGEHQNEKPQDISHVDQQEGAMHNGELGGNLNEMQGKNAEEAIEAETTENKKSAG